MSSLNQILEKIPRDGEDYPPQSPIFMVDMETIRNPEMKPGVEVELKLRVLTLGEINGDGQFGKRLRVALRTILASYLAQLPPDDEDIHQTVVGDS